MRAADIRDLPTSEILNKMDASRREMFNLRIAFHTNTLENPNLIRLLRKDMARMLTILRERELAAAYVQGAEPAAAQPSRTPRTFAQPEVSALPTIIEPVIDQEEGAAHGE